MTAIGLIAICLTFVPDWLLVKAKTECGGSEKKVGRVLSIDDCAAACEVHSSMFAFGTTDYGFSPPRCSNDNTNCECLCETSASPDGTCQEKPHIGYRLYKYLAEDKDEGNLVIKERLRDYIIQSVVAR